MKKINKMRVFYDGKCPLCTKEINHYIGIDKKKKIKYIDISAPSFDEGVYGLEGREYNKTFHVQSKSGEFITAVDGFVAIWEELECFKLLACMAKNKLARPFFDVGYTVFTKVRPLFREDDCEDNICER